MSTFPLSIAIAMLLCGCLPSRARKDSSPQAAALPMLDMKLTVTVLDEETGKPIPDAWVLVAAHITTDRPAPSGDLDAIAAARSITGQNGTAWISEVQGTYYPGQPKNDAWRVMEQARADRLGPRKITGVEGGDLVVASPIYGFIHLPFAVEDDPAFKDWLKNGGKKEDYGGWIRKSAVRVNLPLVFVESKDLKKGLSLTIRMRKPRDLDDWAKTISFGAFLEATWLATSVDTGATEEEQRRHYWLFGRTLDQITRRSPRTRTRRFSSGSRRRRWRSWSRTHGKSRNTVYGCSRAWRRKARTSDGAITSRMWGLRRRDCRAPTRRCNGSPSTWTTPATSGTGRTRSGTYAAGDKPKAYEALGHVLRLLVSLAIPKYMQMQEARETEFESAVQALMKDQAGQLPPDYWWSTKQPTFAKTPRARFDDVAQRTVALGLEAGGGATNGHAESPALAQARKSFPAAIGQAAGLLRDFQRLMHLATFAKRPDGGDGGGGTQAGAQASSGTVTDANKFNKFTSGTDMELSGIDRPWRLAKAG